MNYYYYWEVIIHFNQLQIYTYTYYVKTNQKSLKLSGQRHARIYTGFATRKGGGWYA